MGWAGAEGGGLSVFEHLVKDGSCVFFVEHGNASNVNIFKETKTISLTGFKRHLYLKVLFLITLYM